MTLKTKLLIIGAGIIGVMTAKFLVDKGFNDIVIVEKKYPGSGGTYRCATGIRASFTSLEHVELMKRSINLWPILSKQHNIPYKRGGYIWLLSRPEHVELFKKIVDFHHKHDIPTKIISPEEIREIVPTIRTDNLLAGVYDPLAGKASCFLSLLNILEYIKKKGVKVIINTPVYKLVTRNHKVVGAMTSKGVIEAEKILVAAGHGSKKILDTIGLDLPLENIPKHALITEAYKPLFDPLLIDWQTSSYIVQVLHGGFLIGANIEEKPNTPPTNRIDYLFLAANIWTKYFPWLPYVRVLRYWTGYYVMTPDHHPVIGPVEEYENLYVATGFSGHGFMMSPAVGEAMANYILGQKQNIPYIENLSPERFTKGKLVKEIAVFG
ncbi:FAD dependent oxidoreductase [Staphylothermus marinus F1]|uniref:FAD dependent oxidoreductase n=1 Tax=Staphylothermus marinus (strain ATCC 43588 / DSM 3639 / JCM 9404 / F1) TaxID=399550 RepID=A3DKG2_STAMF|nr:FAD-binding oxidoreductase [Staphylothermus marinus]ABN69122.1 FAD dependent oxidoreductase [Staphylothermus marinus F1]